MTALGRDEVTRSGGVVLVEDEEKTAGLGTTDNICGGDEEASRPGCLI